MAASHNCYVILPARLAAPTALIFASGLALSACGSSDAPADTSAGGSTSSAAGGQSGQGDSKTLVGAFVVKLSPASDLGEASTAVLGKVYDSATPSAVVWESALSEGNCVLTTPRYPFCTTPCANGSVCVEDDTCAASPTSHSVGTVTVTGLRRTDSSDPFTMNPINTGYQPLGDVTLAYPPFAEADAVTFAATGGDFAAFSIASKGIAPLLLSSTDLTLKTGVGLDLAWTKGNLADATIHAKVNISRHGGTKGQIDCETADTGALSISPAMMTKLLNLGVAGYPTVIVTRHVIGSAVIAPGRVDLEVESVIEQPLEVDGLTSCTDDDDCATGHTCHVEDQTCK